VLVVQAVEEQQLLMEPIVVVLLELQILVVGLEVIIPVVVLQVVQVLLL
jgi:hypothetical protein